MVEDDIKKIEQDIRELDRKIEEMHLKVQQYLSDRSKYPFPHHENIISEVLKYEIKGVKSRELELRLDQLQFKATNKKGIWKKWFEER